MTPPRPILHVRRLELARALQRPAVEIQVLVALLVRACPDTGRVWEPPVKIAESLGLPVALVEDALHALAGLDFLEDHPTLFRQLRCIELGAIWIRPGVPPSNLPIESPAV